MAAIVFDLDDTLVSARGRHGEVSDALIETEGSHTDDLRLIMVTSLNR